MCLCVCVCVCMMADALGPLKNEQKDAVSEKLSGLLDSDKSAKSSGESVGSHIASPTLTHAHEYIHTCLAPSWCSHTPMKNRVWCMPMWTRHDIITWHAKLLACIRTRSNVCWNTKSSCACLQSWCKVVQCTLQKTFPDASTHTSLYIRTQKRWKHRSGTRNLVKTRMIHVPSVHLETDETPPILHIYYYVEDAPTWRTAAELNSIAAWRYLLYTKKSARKDCNSCTWVCACTLMTLMNVMPCLQTSSAYTCMCTYRAWIVTVIGAGAGWRRACTHIARLKEAHRQDAKHFCARFSRSRRGPCRHLTNCILFSSFFLNPYIIDCIRFSTRHCHCPLLCFAQSSAALVLSALCQRSLKKLLLGCV